jgi:hypothetical protein
MKTKTLIPCAALLCGCATNQQLEQRDCNVAATIRLSWPHAQVCVESSHRAAVFYDHHLYHVPFTAYPDGSVTLGAPKLEAY